MPETPTRLPLTPGEVEALDLVGQGLSGPQIAAQQHRSLKAVQNQLTKARLKLGAKSTTQAVRIACEQGLLKAAA